MSDPYFVYQWKGGEVVKEAVPESWSQLENQGIDGHMSVDQNHLEPKNRYGYYRSLDESWKHVPLEDFPPEFRMHLLLLGVV